jgi:type II secretory pathway pseudopilin PulG
MQKRKKRPLTLLEIMIVIFLIGLIGSVIGFNMKGSIDEGRYFKTEQAAKQIREILLLEVAKGKATIDNVIEDPETHLKNAKILKDPKKMLKDGWGTPFQIARKGSSDDIVVTSEKYKDYRATRNRKGKGQAAAPVNEDEEDQE